MSKPHGKMPISQRAKQFAPFAAVGGLDAAIARKEKEHQMKERAELAEDAKEDINRKLGELYIGENAEVEYFFMGRYQIKKGRVNDINVRKCFLKIDDVEIHFKDIYSIK